METVTAEFSVGFGDLKCDRYLRRLILVLSSQLLPSASLVAVTLPCGLSPRPAYRRTLPVDLGPDGPLPVGTAQQESGRVVVLCQEGHPVCGLRLEGAEGLLGHRGHRQHQMVLAGPKEHRNSDQRWVVSDSSTEVEEAGFTVASLHCGPQVSGQTPWPWIGSAGTCTGSMECAARLLPSVLPETLKTRQTTVSSWTKTWTSLALWLCCHKKGQR